MFGRPLVQLERKAHKNKQRLDSCPRKKKIKKKKKQVENGEGNDEAHSSTCRDFLLLDKQHSNSSNLIKWSFKENQ